MIFDDNLLFDEKYDIWYYICINIIFMFNIIIFIIKDFKFL